MVSLFTFHVIFISFSGFTNDTRRLTPRPLLAAAAWKIVRSWLGPEAISKLKFASRAEVQMFISLEYLPPHMGGTVSFFFIFSTYTCDALNFTNSFKLLVFSHWLLSVTWGSFSAESERFRVD